MKKVQEPAKVFQLIKRLEIPEMCWEARLDIANQLRKVVSNCQVSGHRELFYLGKVPRHRELFCSFDL